MKLLKYTPEYKILCVLTSGGKSFTMLKRETDLSSRWLSRTLDKLLKDNLVQKSGSLYELASLKSMRETVRSELDELNRNVALMFPSVGMHGKAVRAADLISKEPGVIGVILFGSVAKGTSNLESDIDLLVICAEKSDLTDIVYDAMVNVEAPIEALTMTFKQFLINLIDEPTMIFGVIEAYEVLHDRFNMIKGLLNWKEEDIKKRWFYDTEEEIWLEKRLQPYSKQHMTSY